MENKKGQGQIRSDKPLITIVVPVYNVAAYLSCCLCSIQKQSYRNLEILLVDDGSTDDSAKICQRYCDLDSRFQLVQQQNQGLGSARNTGLDLAKGSYICFVDADDYIHPDYVKILLENLISSHADLSVCQFRTFEGEAPIQYDEEKTEQKNELKILDQLELLNALLQEHSATTVVVWNKLTSVKWLKGFHFVNKWHEDQFMINEYVRRCRKAVFTSAVLYKYRKRPDSIMGAENRQDLRHLDDLEAYEQRIKYFYQPKYKAEWKDLFKIDLNHRINLYSSLYNKENAYKLRQLIYPRYVWGFWQYLKTGGLFYKGGHRRRLIVFLISPELYIRLRNCPVFIRNRQ